MTKNIILFFDDAEHARLKEKKDSMLDAAGKKMTWKDCLIKGVEGK